MAVAMNTAQLIAYFEKLADDESLSEEKRFHAFINAKLWREFHRTTVAPVAGNQPAPPERPRGADVRKP